VSTTVPGGSDTTNDNVVVVASIVPILGASGTLGKVDTSVFDGSPLPPIEPVELFARILTLYDLLAVNPEITAGFEVEIQSPLLREYSYPEIGASPVGAVKGIFNDV
jgi:hypothetical protein